MTRIATALTAAAFTLIFAASARAAQEHPDPPTGQPPAVVRLLGEKPPEAAGPASHDAPGTTGGPDSFGYAWDDTIPFTWLDATAGEDIHLAGDDVMSYSIPISFSFPFYERSYDKVNVSSNGALALKGYVPYRNSELPSPKLPDGIIAAFWDDWTVGASFNSGKVWVLRGGSAPNRHFVVQWDGVTRCCSPGSTQTQTFQVVLRESGDVLMQFKTLTGTLNSATVGIENVDNSDGLQWVYNQPGATSGKAVRFSRPGPSARVKAMPLSQGQLVGNLPASAATFPLVVSNIGQLGADRYDVTTSASGWGVRLLAPDGATTLSDTNGNGKPDTGPIAQGGVITVFVSLTPPPSAVAGDYTRVDLTFKSALNASKIWTTSVQAAVPAAFAQAYSSDPGVDDRLVLARPPLTWDRVLIPNAGDYDLALAETADLRFAYGFSRYGCADPCGPGIRTPMFVLATHAGQIVTGPIALSDLVSATLTTYDDTASIAAAPDGRIGFLWQRMVYSSTSEAGYQKNILFAIADAEGNLVHGPENLTHNNAFNGGDAVGIHDFGRPSIAATSDSRFVLVWDRTERTTPGGGWLYDVYYAVRNSNGIVITAPTRLSNGVPDGDYFENGSVSRSSGNRALIVYGGNSGVVYAVIDSAGAIVKAPAIMGWYANNVRAATLGDGRAIIAGSVYSSTSDSFVIGFARIDSSYNPIGAPAVIGNSAPPGGEDFVGIIARPGNRAVLTWGDAVRGKAIYYALIDSDGSIITPPIAFIAGRGDGVVYLSYFGRALATYSSVAIIPRAMLPVMARH